MPKRDVLLDDYIISEYGNWNVAADYARLKIMKPLYMADEYEMVAEFGFLDMNDELINKLAGVDDGSARITALKRLIKVLILVIDNTLFAIRGDSHKRMKEFKEELKRIKELVPKLYTIRRNEKTKTTSMAIKEDLFKKVLDRVGEIKAEMNEHLNKYDLIFTHREEIDPSKIKESIIERYVNRT